MSSSVLSASLQCSYQVPLSIGFSRQEYWSGLPFPSPEDLPNPGIESRSPALQADSLLSEPPEKPTSITFIKSIAFLYTSNEYYKFEITI